MPKKNLSKDKLTMKQEAFAWSWAEGETRGNATRSAIAAGYSERTAGKIGYKLLRLDHVWQRIKEIRDEMASRKILSVAQALAIVSEIAEKGESEDRDKLRAATILLQSEGALVDKKEIGGIEGGAIHISWKSAQEVGGLRGEGVGDEGD